MRIGILGCGRMGNERARSAVALGHELAVLYDPDLERARTLRAKYKASEVISSEREVPWPRLHAVFICTPPSQRCKFELPAIEAGLPFFVEKPVALTAPDCIPVLEALRSRPVINAVGYMNRCRNSVLFARRVLARSNILGVCCHWVGRQYKVGWWLDRDHSGGPLNEQATHAFDLCRLLVGEIHSVSATAKHSAGPSELALTVACTLTFADGPVGALFYSCEAADKQINLRVLAAQGMLEFSGWDLCITANTINGTLPQTQEEDIFLKETDQFLNAIQRGDPTLIPCDLADAYRTQLAMDAALTSLRSGELTSVGIPVQLESAS
jgi:myo-inositol 2-dehydrogenase/D-chiro-inositol 1-dehydrogenase